MDQPIRATILGDEMSLSVNGVSIISAGEGYDDVTLNTSRGEVHCRYYRADGADLAVVMVGGVEAVSTLRPEVSMPPSPRSLTTKVVRR